MWLKVPEKVEEILWEGTLIPAQEKGTVRDTSKHGGESEKLTEDDFKKLPIVSIGQPVVWTLKEFYNPEEIPYSLKTKMDEADFYIVRFACSFRSILNAHQVKWARFFVQLLIDESEQHPIAFDLYPLRVNRDVKHNVRVTISPTLKFKEMMTMKVDKGSCIEYTELHPIISASGVGEAVPTWDYYETKEVPVQGSKFMYLLLQVPLGINTVKAELKLFANVKIKDSVFLRLIMRDEQKACDQLIVNLVKK